MENIMSEEYDEFTFKVCPLQEKCGYYVADKKIGYNCCQTDTCLFNKEVSSLKERLSEACDLLVHPEFYGKSTDYLRHQVSDFIQREELLSDGGK